MFESIYDSIEYEGSRNLRKYKKQLQKINELTDHYRQMSLEQLKAEADTWTSIDLKNKKQITRLYALGREVCYRLLGKFHYDVQILGALAALERQMVQMSTGSGKTLTLILPTLAYGLTHKGVSVLTVNDYLSKRDWEETRIIYDFFNLTNMYTSSNDAPFVQNQAFNCDITYSTNSTLGFAYLNSTLASGIGMDVKPISRPLHAAIIDEVDEILMDDARNPLIIASGVDMNEQLNAVVHNGKTYKVMDIMNKLRTLKSMDGVKDDPNTLVLGDEAWDEIYELFDVDNTLFENADFVHVIHNCVEALFKQKVYENYIVASEPDPDSGSRVILIDKATGRLARGRTLNDSLHAFVEMKEGVFTGSGSESSLQITYQVLFNLFPHITGVTGTLGKSYKEFFDIYGASVIQIPDRLPNKLKQQTHLYMTRDHLLKHLVKQVNMYQVSRHPILIGAASDIEAELVSDYLNKCDVDHVLLVSTDTNEEVVIASAGEVGSIVVTTDIMGRGTDIHIQETDYERGLVVFQIGTRPNSRVERQFAGRAARQGDPGRYHRMITLPELDAIEFPETRKSELLKIIRKYRQYIEQYDGDVLLNKALPEYAEVVTLIDDTLTASESAESQNRIQGFQASHITDLIQVTLAQEMDVYREIVRDYTVTKEPAQVRKALARLSTPHDKRKKKRIVASQEKLWEDINPDQCAELLYAYTEKVVHELIPQIREYSETAIRITNLAQMAKHETKPEYYMSDLMAKYMASLEPELMVPVPST